MQSVPTTISLEFYNLRYRLTTLLLSDGNFVNVDIWPSDHKIGILSLGAAGLSNAELGMEEISKIDAFKHFSVHLRK